MERTRIADWLDRHGFLLEMEGANPFQCRAYTKAARELRHLGDEEFATRLAAGTLGELPGFGKVLVAKIVELAAGSIPSALAETVGKYPAPFLELTRVSGLGPKKLAALLGALGPVSPGELEYACRENRLLGISGFGAKSQESILRSLEFLRQAGGRVLLPEADAIAARLLAAARGVPGVARVEVAGELRRRFETVDRFVLIVEADAAGLDAVRAAIDRPAADSASALEVELHSAPAGLVGATWLVATGPPSFVAALRDRCAPRPLESIPGDEAEVLAALGLPFLAPELRDLPGLVPRAAAGALPPPVEAGDLRALFHLHTTASDGALTLRETLVAAQRMGVAAVGISDHSKSAAYAGGLDAARVRAQRAEIDALRGEFPALAIFHGTESDILGDGSLDFDEETLAAFDFVIASVHSRFGLSRDEMTARLVAAVSNRFTTILGHPTGRLLLSRPGYDFDLEAVLDAAAAAGTAVELNASPYRLDLDWRDLSKALDRGIAVAIDPDAHSLGDLSNLRFGVDAARKGGATAAQVWNAGDAETIRERLAVRRRIT